MGRHRRRQHKSTRIDDILSGGSIFCLAAVMKYTPRRRLLAVLTVVFAATNVLFSLAWLGNLNIPWANQPPSDPLQKPKWSQWVPPPRNVTDSGINLTDPSLYATLNYTNSENATVMTLALGFRQEDYERFVGTLRKHGYKGHILMAINASTSYESTLMQYLHYRNVTYKVIESLNGTNSCVRTGNKCVPIVGTLDREHESGDEHIVPAHWTRYALFRDWLEECATCTGPVLHTGFGDTYFQDDPFRTKGAGSFVKGLQLYRVDHSSLDDFNRSSIRQIIHQCTGVPLKRTPVLSGAVVGTRDAMLKYFHVLSEEVKNWTSNPTNCSASDEALHNYLYYSGQLPFATAIQNRYWGIVNNVGYLAVQAIAKHNSSMFERYTNLTNQTEAMLMPFDGRKGSRYQRWIGEEYGLVDDQGFFTQFDGKRSKVVHGFRAFAAAESYFLNQWLHNSNHWWDTMPPSVGRSIKKSWYRASKTPFPPDVAPFASETYHWQPQNTTETGIDLTDPKLYETVDLQGDSSTATVISMATGYDLEVYGRFVGSLRKSGFKGHIILAVELYISPEVEQYFKYRNVTFKAVEMIPASECVNGKADFSHILKSQRCSKKYPHLKATWARHALFRDWLQECETCTGPVLYIDSRDAYFQDDPFGPGSPPVKGLNLYQVGDGASTKASFVGNAILQCKNRTYNEPMLCAGSTVGTKAAMVKYLEIMVKEIEAWMDFPDCAFSDQGIHNHLFYSGQLPFAKSMENWVDGIVNTIGYVAEVVVKEHVDKMLERNNRSITAKEAKFLPFDGATDTRWIGDTYELVDDEGYFTQIDNTRSRVIHQFDRFGRLNSHGLNNWLKNSSWSNIWWDPVPVSEVISDFDHDESFSACLLILDEMHRLPEWIAYHYYALPLRHLVVAVDPASKTSYKKLFKHWRTRMTIEEWTDEDFTSENLLRNASDDIDAAIDKHRTRQSKFYSQCTKYHREHNRNWTAYIDTDEFLTISSDAVNNSQQLMHQPGSVLRLLKTYSNETAQRRSDVPDAWYDRFQKSPCAMIPRVLFSAYPSKTEEVVRHVPAVINATQLDTLRWRYRATRRFDGTDRHIDDWGKSIMDVSRLKPEDFKDGGTAHFVLNTVCDREQRMTNYSEVPLGIHHYLGSWEAFSCREDARMGSWRHSKEKWEKRARLKRGGADDQLRPWINGFVKMVGPQTAKFLLRKSGILKNCTDWSLRPRINATQS